MKFRRIKSALFITVLGLVFTTISLSGLNAQAEKLGDDSAAKTEGVGQPASDKPSEASETSKANEEMGKGIYWWADIDPAAIGAFPEFGIYNVAFRLGSLGILSTPSAETGLPAVGWKDGGDFPKIATLPTGIKYRPVIETEASFWEKANPDSIIAFFKDNVFPGLKSSGIQFEFIELKLPEIKAGMANTGLESALKGMAESGDGTKVLVGVEPEIFSKVPWEQLTSIAAGIDGFVIYFQDFEYTGLSPKITDRAWIDAALSEANRLGKPLTAVIPVYNRALYYPADKKSEMKIIPALDTSRLAKISEVRSMGAAGTEYIVRETGEDFPFKPGDRIRIVESIKEVDASKLIADVRNIAPYCMTVDLFRFPLVPGFDPPAKDILASAGWLGGGTLSETTTTNPEKTQLDEKYNKGSQLIWMLTIGLMMVLFLRMFSKVQKDGKGTGTGSGGGGAK